MSNLPSLSKMPEYNSWSGMKSRCNNSNDARYHSYGGRGIKVCDEWQHNFKAFLDYVGNRPSKDHSIDRVDNDGNYEPGNVRWATYIEQNNNRRVRFDSASGVPGITWYKITKRWRVDIYPDGEQYNVGYFKNLDDAIEARKKALEELK